MLAARWQARLAELPDAQLEPELRRIAALGDAGIPVLVRAIASPREVLAASARNALLDELTRWELLPPARAKAKLAILAEALSNMASNFDPPARRFAADLAMRILHWPHEDGDPNRPALLAHCEAVLAAAAIRPGANLSIAADPTGAAALGSSDNSDSNERLANLTRLPGGGLPFEMANMPPPRQPISPDSDDKNPSTAEPNKLPTAAGAKPLGDATPSDPSNAADQAPAANQPRRLTSTGNRAAQFANAGTIDAGSAATDASGLPGARLREVVEKLDSGDPQSTAAARAELERRAITGPLVDLARRLADPDPAVRLRLTETLPTLSGVDARAWLLELSYDEDAQVRAAAVTLMATSGDIDLLKRVQQVALDDPDDQTRAQAEKALPRAKRR
jgi:hypothetical protein